MPKSSVVILLIVSELFDKWLDEFGICGSRKVKPVIPLLHIVMPFSRLPQLIVIESPTWCSSIYASMECLAVICEFLAYIFIDYG